MRRWRTVLGATVAALVLTSGGAAQAAQELHPTTKANLQAAMHAEAFAYAKYTLFAEAAASSGHPDVAALFGRTAGVELRDHFTAESKLLGFVGSNLANLQVGISGESQDLTDYARWAQEATTDGCDAAAELFAEVRRDEAGHLVRYTAAVQALVDPETGATVPAPPTVTPVAVRPGPATCSARTVRNLQAAMAGEAFAYAKYTLFADNARATGQPQLAALFAATAEVELREHFTGEANLAGLVGSTAANLRAAIAGETEDLAMYGSYAAAATRIGDRSAAELFREIQRDEQGHQAAFHDALATLSPVRHAA